MLGILQSILCAIQKLGALIIDLLVMSLNGLILLIGTTLALVLSALPQLPDVPGAPSSGVLGFVNWIVPVVPLMAFFTTSVALWIAFLAVKVALNWFRAL